MRLLFLFSLFSILLAPVVSEAEYRAFLLQIQTAEGTPVREILSTLDPDQYRGYFPIPIDHKIVYTQTWRCPGRTGDFLSICPNPRLIEPPSENSDQRPDPPAPDSK